MASQYSVTARDVAMMPEAERTEFYESLTKDERERLQYDWPFWARANQLNPAIPARGGADWEVWLFKAGRGCIAPGTLIYDPIAGTHTAVEVLAERGEPITVWSKYKYDADLAAATSPFLKGYADLYRVRLSNGREITVTDQHRFFSICGWEKLGHIPVGNQILCGNPETKEEDLYGELLWATIESIEFSHFGPYYDLTVPGPANYLANGIWNHNSGKTRAGAEWIRSRVESGLAKRIALVGHTADEIRKVMIEGDSGLLNVCPPWNRPVHEPTKRQLTWPNGAIATTFSDEEPGRLRGPQFDTAWCDELSKWSHAIETWSQLGLGMRLGRCPQIMVTTTPPSATAPTQQGTAAYFQILTDPMTAVSQGSTYDNIANLAERYINRIIRTVEGTRAGQVEIYAIEESSVPGALWTPEMIERDRMREGEVSHRDMMRSVVGVDPAGSLQEMALFVAGLDDVEPEDITPSGRCEVGIVVAGRDERGHGYVFADKSNFGGPAEWGGAVVDAYKRFGCSRVVAETNHGGKTVEQVIRTIEPHISFQPVRAAQSKVARAEPVAALYEKGLIHHVGIFPLLERQMTSYVAGMKSPDRLDAIVWAMHALFFDVIGNSVMPATVGVRPTLHGHYGRSALPRPR